MHLHLLHFMLRAMSYFSCIDPAAADFYAAMEKDKKMRRRKLFGQVSVMSVSRQSIYISLCWYQYTPSGV